MHHDASQQGATAQVISVGLKFECPLQFWIVRHPDSEANEVLRTAKARGLLTFRSVRDADVAVTARGIRQQEALGQWFVSTQFRSMFPLDHPNMVVTSPYDRALGAAQTVARYLGLTRVYTDWRLRERDYGISDNLTEAGLEQLQPEEHERMHRLGRFYHCPPGGESWPVVIDRVRDILRDIARNYPDARPVIISHSRTIYCTRCLMEGLSEREILAYARTNSIPNCGVTSYRWNPSLDMYERGLDCFLPPGVESSSD